jgi:phosphate transport system permease protein
MVAPPSRRSLFSRTKFFDARFGDGLFYWTTLILASLILVLVVWLGIQLFSAALPAIKQFGPGFLTHTKWNPITEIYGAWPFIFGTLYSSFLAEIAPKWMRTPLSFMVELLAAVPSVVYGLWGRLVLIPAILPLQGWLSEHASNWPIVGKLFEGAPMGQSMMAGGLILAIMILPFITAVSREVIKAVPPTQREAAFGLGATHWEAISGPILRTARSGIIGAIILGLARALGETMAITMVIGNGNDASMSLLAPANTLSSKLALEFAEASGGQQSALMYLALTLFCITIIVNSIARMLIWNMARSVKGSTRG